MPYFRASSGQNYHLSLKENAMLDRNCLKIICWLFCAYVPSTFAQPANSADTRFQVHTVAVLDALWRAFPEHAVDAGFYKYADQMTVPNQSYRDASIAF